MMHLTNYSKKRNRVVILACLVISTTILFLSIYFKQPRNYESYIKQNKKRLEKILGFKEIDEKLYNEFAIKKWFWDAFHHNWYAINPEDWFYVDYRKEEIERYKEHYQEFNPNVELSGLNNAFYCGGGRFYQEVFEFEAKEQANQLFSYYKKRYKERYQEINTFVYVRAMIIQKGLLETESYIIYCEGEKGTDSISYDVIIKNEDLAIVNYTHYLKEEGDDRYDKFVKYLKEIGLPSLDQVQMKVEGSEIQQSEE